MIYDGITFNGRWFSYSKFHFAWKKKFKYEHLLRLERERRFGRNSRALPSTEKLLVSLIYCKMNSSIYVCIPFNSVDFVSRSGVCVVHLWFGYVWCIFERVSTSHISSYLSHFDRMLPCHIHTITSNANTHTFLHENYTHTISLSLSNSLTLGDIQSE